MVYMFPSGTVEPSISLNCLHWIASLRIEGHNERLEHIDKDKKCMVIRGSFQNNEVFF